LKRNQQANGQEKKFLTGHKFGLTYDRLIKPLASRNSSMIRVVFH